ncbi:TOMM precursor leader peptide-binding protein [Streptomyces sp. TP-A0874]|uniref:TOMM precursor leader peptide-binding protein n=1 Tax=Streptomyces sp. TP-A0874 TaxID=549819 RepID=UPI000852D673|nr:TOMM precursor leader peptide-binding protein [Streptomyces sp. TP-A0874]
MTGELSIADLCEGLDEGRRNTSIALMKTLLAKGFARHAAQPEDGILPDAVLARFSPQINFVEHFMHADTRTPQELFARFRTARVLVTGPPGEVVTSVVRGLLRNGLAETALDDPAWKSEFDADLAELAAEGAPAGIVVPSGTPRDPDGYDVIVAVTDGSDGASLLDLTKQVVGDRATDGHGPRLLPVVVDRDRAVIGPIAGPAEQPCWMCAQLRLSANTDPSSSAAFWQGLALGTDAPGGAPLGGSTVAQSMIGNGVAFEVFRLRTGQLSPDDEAHAVLKDLTTLESRRERVLPHPRCPVPHRAAAPAADAPAEAQPVDADPGRPDFDSAAYEQAGALVSPNLGLLSDWADESIKQVPVKSGRVLLGAAGSPAGGARRITAFDTDVILHARIRAVRSAVSTYVGRLGPVGREERPDSAPTIRPNRLSVHSGAPSIPHRSRSWLPVASLHDGSAWRVPDAAVYPLSPVNQGLEFEPTSSGAAAGWTVEAVREEGLCSALAYRGLTGAIRGTAPVGEVDSSVLATDEEASFALASLRHIGRTARVFALPGAAPAFAALAVVDGPDGAPADWAVGSGLSARAAVRAATLDAVGLAVTRHYEGAPADLGDPLLTDFDPAVLPDGAAACDWSLDGTEVAMAEVLATLAAGGTQALFADTTTIDLRSARGLVTGTVLLAAEPAAAD